MHASDSFTTLWGVVGDCVWYHLQIIYEKHILTFSLIINLQYTRTYLNFYSILVNWYLKHYNKYKLDIKKVLRAKGILQSLNLTKIPYKECEIHMTFIHATLCQIKDNFSSLKTETEWYQIVPHIRTYKVVNDNSKILYRKQFGGRIRSHHNIIPGTFVFFIKNNMSTKKVWSSNIIQLFSVVKFII